MANVEARSVADIEAEIAAARERLADSVSALIDEVHPKAAARRSIASASATLERRASQARTQLVDDQGKLKVGKLAVIGAAVAGLVTLMLLLRKLTHRKTPRVVG